MPNIIDPAMTNILVREIKAHNEAITSINKFSLRDIDGLLTCSKDHKAKTWSLGLDMIGVLNLTTDREDPKWVFPTKSKKIKRENEISELESIMNKLELDLEGERRKLIVDDTQIVKKEDVKKKSRMNWFKM